MAPLFAASSPVFRGVELGSVLEAGEKNLGLYGSFQYFYKEMSLVFTPSSEVSRDIAIEKDIFAAAPRRFE